MTERHAKTLRVHRAHVIRLSKRAVKRDEFIPGRMKVICSWNLSALALEHITEVRPISQALADFFVDAAADIQVALTEDPSPVVERPIGLSDGVIQTLASQWLYEMAEIVTDATDRRSAPGARLVLQQLYGVEINAIRDTRRTL